MTERDRPENEFRPDGESPCLPNGNYGFCRTHPTCDMVKKKFFDLVFILEDLARAADTAELCLRDTHPARAQSLGELVGRAKAALESVTWKPPRER